MSLSQSPPSGPLLNAVVYCEGCFGTHDGKTANGLVRHSEKYKILAVVDSALAGKDCSEVIEGIKPGIPICSDLADAKSQIDTRIDSYIFGKAPADGFMSQSDRKLILEAISFGMNIVSGMHEFLSDDTEFAIASRKYQVDLIDVRKPRPRKELQIFSGNISKVPCPRIAILGTDCAIGKRTTARILTEALQRYGLKAIMISTGQTGLIQSAKYGVALDSVPSQFCAGELESVIVRCYEKENPDIIIVEGQGSLGHPAFSTSSFILRGSCPDGVILQHAPARTHRCDFSSMPMPKLFDEKVLIETFANTRVIGVTINHEKMSQDEVSESISSISVELGIPTADALTSPEQNMVDMVLSAFPGLSEKRVRE